MEGSNLITKLQAKHDLLQRTLGEGQLSERVGEMTWIISCVVYVFHEEYEPCEFVLIIKDSLRELKFSVSSKTGAHISLQTPRQFLCL